KLLVIFITLSIAASLFCANMMLGYAESLYRYEYSSSDFAAVTFSNIGEKTKNTELCKYINDNYKYNVGSALYFAKQGDNIIIGFEGTDTITNWVPSVSGRFFTDDERKNGEKVAYISESIYSSLDDKSKISLAGKEFDVIGCGWIIDFNFSDCISEDSPQTIFDLNRITKGEKDRYSYYFIPYVTFVDEGFEPELVLMRFDDMSKSEIEKAAKKLQNDFLDSVITLSPHSSNKILFNYTVAFGFVGIVLFLIVWLGFINIIYEWISATKQIAFVYMCCGVSKNKMAFAILFELFMLFMAGDAIALAVQASFMGFFSEVIGMSAMPRIAAIIAVFAISYLLTMLSVNKRLNTILQTKRTVD
ncbi:MAG: ABC transporter permease, partial [Eubacteriales bacterium]